MLGEAQDSQSQSSCMTQARRLQLQWGWVKPLGMEALLTKNAALSLCLCKLKLGQRPQLLRLSPARHGADFPDWLIGSTEGAGVSGALGSERRSGKD